MIRFLLFIVALCWALRWLSELTALPDAKPLSAAELPALLMVREKDPSHPGSPTLPQAFELALKAIEKGAPSRPEPASTAPFFPEEGFSPELAEALRTERPNSTKLASLVLQDAEALPNDSLELQLEDRSRLLRLSLRATEKMDPLTDPSSPTWVNVGLRQLEIPTSPDARDPGVLEIVRDAATLVGRLTPDPAKRDLYYRRLKPLHPSPVMQGEIQRVLVAPR